MHAQSHHKPWNRHTIDDSFEGADGIKLADVNGDGLLDITTGWEESGVTRLYLNPGPAKVKDKWPAVTVGNTPSVEDAVFVDVDADGVMDVVSSTEGESKTIFVHWAPNDKEKYLDSNAWRTEALPTSKFVTQWMFSIPMEIDGKNGIDLVAGGKGPDAKIGWFESPANPQELSAWAWHPLFKTGWIMSLVSVDMDGDADRDILLSDRRGPSQGCYWLENPGSSVAKSQPWKRHLVGADGKEVMFLTLADLDRNGMIDILVTVKPRDVLYLRRMSRDGKAWEAFPIQLPENAGTAKAVGVGDINLDNRLDIVFSCEGAIDGRSGVMWMSYEKAVTDRVWNAHEISGPKGVKYDLVELLDLDGDGDLDVITCEEREKLGVFWYENPHGKEVRGQTLSFSFLEHKKRKTQGVPPHPPPKEGRCLMN
ncbi:VCBS repeat-containing protein [Acidobacteria bacterium AH-259-L09]|nr:VCBS repeat-containing protein [Acidobacteria bacterium AH-259-L09]